MAIRTRIILVVLALVVVAVGILDVVSYTVVRRSLVSRADAELQAAAPTLYHILLTSPGSRRGLCDGLPLGSFVVLVTPVRDFPGGCPGTRSVTQLTERLPTWLTKGASEGSGPVFTTDGDNRLMAQTMGIGAFGGSVLVVGEPLAPAYSTLRKVLLLELVVSGSVLVAVALVALFLIRLGLLPLEKMARTAGEIAAGDLSRRVEDDDERTEVGQLGAALNVMLARIEEAFRAKEASEEQLRQFVADASHELRTPLTSIRGYAELFQRPENADTGDLARALRRIESESSRMSELVEDLLLLARLDQGRALEHQPVDLGPVVAGVVADARMMAPARAISLELSGVLLVSGETSRLHQVVSNLVSNALSHTPEGSPVEVIGAVTEGGVRLQVVDHGAGVPAEERAKVFGRFWRADGSRQRSRGGAGLGLSIVAAVVTAHGGRVLVAETEGGGATFVVDLPASPQRGDEEESGDTPKWDASTLSGISSSVRPE